MPLTGRVGPVEAAGLVERLRAAGCVYAEEEAEIMVSSASSPAELESLTAARVAGDPLEHLVGWTSFAGVRMVVGPGVFVPRRRSELLVALTVRLAPPSAVVVDLCCGSGALAAAVAARRPDLEVYAADVDPVSVDCAARNLGPARVFLGDLYGALPDSLRGGIDVLVVNAPYVPSDDIALMPPEARDHEPRAALDGGPDGVAVHRRVAAGSPDWLAPRGYLVLETSRRQAAVTAAAMASAALKTEVHHDRQVQGTAVVGWRSSVDRSGGDRW